MWLGVPFYGHLSVNGLNYLKGGCCQCHKFMYLLAACLRGEREQLQKQAIDVL